MSPRLNAPVLSVDAAKMHKIDPRNVESLFGMWTVFSKCADSIEGGKRYENLSWRLWNRETFCCPAQPQLAITPAISVPGSRPSSKDIPELSASVDSIVSDKSESSNLQDSSSDLEDSALSRSRGHEKHLTPYGLRKMVVNIKEMTELEPLSPSIEANLPAITDITPRPMSPPAGPQIHLQEPSDTAVERLQNSTESCTNASTCESDHRGSDSSVSSDGGLIRSGSVVHGFSPSQMTSSFRSRTKLIHKLPIETIPRSPAKIEKSKNGATFTLGGSSGDDESSFEDRMSFRPQRSSLSESLGRQLSHKKKPSFRDVVQAHRQEQIKEGSNEATDEDVIASSDEEDDDDDAIDSAIDSAIDDEDDGDWVDSNSDDGKPAVEDKTIFKRVDSLPNLVSRRSMLTTALHEPERAAALASAASRSTPAIRRSRPQSPQGPSLPASPGENEDDVGLTMQAPGMKARPRPIIMSATNLNQLAHSPRTTRRNMLSTELTRSLRDNMILERQQKSTTVNAFAKRRHTAQNVSGLKAFPEPDPDPIDPAKNNFLNHDFDAADAYHNKGW